MSQSQPKDIVIVGGGIIGVCSAYYLSSHPSFSPGTTRITILEASSIGAGASGKAGGLLAKWAYPSCIVPLSFRLHEELAEKFDGVHRWGYRDVMAGSIEAVATQGEGGNKGVSLEKKPSRRKGGGKIPGDLDWLSNGAVLGYDSMAREGETAQVHPMLFTEAIAEEAKKNGVEIVFGRVTDVIVENSEVKGVEYISNEGKEKKTLQADKVVLAAGPWSNTLVKNIPLGTVRAHSVVIKPEKPVSKYVLFTSISMQGKKRTSTVTPEIYARPDGTVYCCGEGDRVVPLPETAGEVFMDETKADEVLDHVTSISDVLRQGEVIAKQACYLPIISGEGGPLVGWSKKVKGLLIATGHTCWGIQNSAGTGKVVSELVWDGKVTSADITELDPSNWGV